MPLRDANGAATGWLGNDTGIHDLRTAEEALLRLNEELERRVTERAADRDRMWRLSADIMLVSPPAARRRYAGNHSGRIGVPVRACRR
jgi:hypothetical protein